jgi:hypothetical protein
MLNRFKVKSDDKGFVLKEIQEMKWRDTLELDFKYIVFQEFEYM